MLEKIYKNNFLKKYKDLKSSDHYKGRIGQKKFTELAQFIIKEVIKKRNLSNECLTSFIQMFKYGCTSDTFIKYLDRLNFSEDIKKNIKSRFIQLGETGYTAAGKSAITKLNNDQLQDVQKLLKKVAYENQKNNIKKAIFDFTQKNIPEVGVGVYSPWLHYLQPTICPVVAGPAKKSFLKRLGYENNYLAAIDLFNELSNLINEKDLGLIDAILYQMKDWGQIIKGEAITSNFLDSHHSISVLLLSKKQVILYGPPGTGKTYEANKIAVNFLNNNFEGRQDNQEIEKARNYNATESGSRNKNSNLWHEFWIGLMQKLSTKSIFKDKKVPYWAGFWASYKKLDFGFHLAQSHVDVIFKIGIKENKELNKKIFNKLYNQRAKIEKALGEHLIWDEMKRQCSSKIYKRFSFQELSNKENWDKLQANMADVMDKYEKVFKYYIDQIEKESSDFFVYE